jgi:hypothetical protein
VGGAEIVQTRMDALDLSRRVGRVAGGQNDIF